jgi:hypothetical protein
MAASAVAPSLLKADAKAVPADGKADWLFEGGTILTMERNQPCAEAVAVRGNTIVYVGIAAAPSAGWEPTCSGWISRGGSCCRG